MHILWSTFYLNRAEFALRSSVGHGIKLYYQNYRCTWILMDLSSGHQFAGHKIKLYYQMIKALIIYLHWMGLMKRMERIHNDIFGWGPSGVWQGMLLLLKLNETNESLVSAVWCNLSLNQHINVCLNKLSNEHRGGRSPCLPRTPVEHGSLVLLSSGWMVS